MPEREQQEHRAAAPTGGARPKAGTESTKPAVANSLYREFALHERESKSASEGSAALREALRQSYPLQSDTFVTESIPALITRLSLKR
jgi:hypothetical protein